MKTVSSRLSEAGYLAFVANILKICRDHLLLYKIPEADYEKAEGLYEQAKVAYEANSLKGSKNKHTLEVKDAAFKDLKTYMHWFNVSLEANLNIPNEALLEMGLPSRETSYHAPIAILTDDIVLRIVRSHRQLDIFASLPEEGQSTKRAGAPNRGGYMIRYWFVGEEDNVIEQISTRLHYVFAYGLDQVGKTIVITASWVNPRMQPGKWSEEYTIVLS